MSYKVIVVGDYPAQSDRDNGTVMQSEKERVLWGVLDRVLKVDVNDFNGCYMLDRPEEGSKHTDKQIKEAGILLKSKLLRLKPKVIVCLGESVMKGLLGIKGISTQRGKVFSWEEDGEIIRVIPTLAPSYVQNASLHLEKFATDLQKAYQYAVGKEEETTVVSTNTLCDTVEKAKQAVDYCLTAGVCCFDFETTKLTDLGTFDPNFKATLLSLSFQHGSSYSIPLHHFQTPFTDDQIQEILLYFFERIMYNPSIIKVAHNLKFDLHVAWRYGCKMVRGRLDDTMLMHHLIDETTLHGLKELTKMYYPELAGYEDAIKQYAWHLIPLKLLCNYGGIDTDITLRLRTQFLNELMEDKRVYVLYRNLVMPALRALFEAEDTGMLIDRSLMERNVARAQELLEMVEGRMRLNKTVLRFEAAVRERKRDEAIADIQEKMIKHKEGSKMWATYESRVAAIKSGVTDVYAGIDFTSWQQLGGLLYSEDGFYFPKPYVKSKRAETEATGKDYLVDLPDESGFVADLLLYRSISKTLSTYLQGILTRLDGNDRVHTSFLQHGTKSGRLSSQNPNLQNLTNVAKLTDPIAIEVVSMVKKPFIPPKGYTLCQIDYSQAELRIIASLAGETNMLNAYNEGKDLHALYASKMLNTTLDEFYTLDPKEQKNWRTRAKAGNFGLIYGMEAEGLVIYAKSNYGVVLTLEEAIKMRNAFFAMYPRLLDYHETYIRKGRQYGYVRTLYGRKRRLPKILDPDDYIRSMDERVAINSPVQGTAGEFTIFALSLLHNRLDKRVRLVNTVHDSIIYYIPDDILASQTAIIKRTCENLPNKKYFGRELQGVSMKVDVEITLTSWKDLQEYRVAA